MSKPLELLLNGLSLDNLPNKVMPEFVCHDHMHVIRRKGCDAELHRIYVIPNVRRKCIRVSLVLGNFLSLVESAIDITCSLTQLVLLDLFPFNVFHMPQIRRYLLLEDLELERVYISFLVFFYYLHVLLETHQGIFKVLRSREISKNGSLVLGAHFDGEAFEAALEIAERDG